MGYTHYWTVKKSFTDKQWKNFVSDVKELFSKTKIPLAGGSGDKNTVPKINNTAVSFNGLENDSHETCHITKSSTEFDFCKTQQKPYDAVVIEVLKLARKHNPSVELSSDGGSKVFNEFDIKNVVYKQIVEIDGVQHVVKTQDFTESVKNAWNDDYEFNNSKDIVEFVMEEL